ncbi:hypothetical protein E2C01_005205 [Portunus trituberculatus]|uniref:Uncharacterized protein n=1 Tax=Portunus trituberculatus TaxID=210409 RepID=A0A5B7CRW9_PORTR|nr:hypothetical protein [Portunus trituberculatus]
MWRGDVTSAGSRPAPGDPPCNDLCMDKHITPRLVAPLRRVKLTDPYMGHQCRVASRSAVTFTCTGSPRGHPVVS